MSGQRWGGKTYAQHGDDLFLLNLCDLLGLENPTWLDIGAHHPIDISNTALLYERGSRGINVEANKKLIPAFIKHRQRDINVCIGVAGTAGKRKFYLIDPTSGLNTFSKDELERIGQRSTDSVELDCVTVNDIVANHAGAIFQGLFPDLLLMDAEGLDLEILQSMDISKSKPKVVMAEIRPHEGSDANKIMVEKGYFRLCRIMANLVFVHSEFMSKVY